MGADRYYSCVSLFIAVYCYGTLRNLSLIATREVKKLMKKPQPAQRESEAGAAPYCTYGGTFLYKYRKCSFLELDIDSSPFVWSCIASSPAALINADLQTFLSTSTCSFLAFFADTHVLVLFLRTFTASGQT